MAKKFESSIALYLTAATATLQDIYDWLEKVEQFNLPRDHKVEEIALSIYIDIPFNSISSIQCGEHIPQDGIFNDVLIATHDCTYSNKE